MTVHGDAAGFTTIKSIPTTITTAYYMGPRDIWGMLGDHDHNHFPAQSATAAIAAATTPPAAAVAMIIKLLILFIIIDSRMPGP